MPAMFRWCDDFDSTKILCSRVHNGVLIPDPYSPQGFTIKFRGQPIKLNPLQEEMAVKFVQKFGTPYLQDRKFCFNFMEDFAEALGLREKATIQDFDWTPIVLAGIIDDNLTMHISAGAVMFLLGWFLRE